MNFDFIWDYIKKFIVYSSMCSILNFITDKLYNHCIYYINTHIIKDIKYEILEKLED